jgi:hypothetical protein
VPQLVVDVPASLEGVLKKERARSRRTTSSIIVAALARYLEKPIHTVFQVSTSGALVAGVYDREVSVEIPAEDLSRRRFGSGAAVKGVGAYTAEVRGSNPLRSTRKSAQIDVISCATG